MRDHAWAHWLAALALPVWAGCAENSLVLKGQMDQARNEQVAISRQKEELQSRATRLDRDNQELVNQLTQTKQQNKILEDRVAVEHANAASPILAGRRVAILMFHQSIDQSFKTSDPLF